MAEYESVLETPELGPGESRAVEVHGRPILLLNVGQTYYALDARCPESGAPLELKTRDHVACTADSAEYDVATGERVDADGRPLRRYQVRVEGNAVKVGPPLAGR